KRPQSIANRNEQIDTGRRVRLGEARYRDAQHITVLIQERAAAAAFNSRYIALNIFEPIEAAVRTDDALADRATELLQYRRADCIDFGADMRPRIARRQSGQPRRRYLDESHVAPRIAGDHRAVEFLSRFKNDLYAICTIHDVLV